MVAESLDFILERIAKAAASSGRSPSEISLVCVSKKQGAEKINEVAAALHQRGLKVVLGESYVQEYKAKRGALVGADEVHMIGPLQSNKVKDSVHLFDLIQSVSSVKTLHLVRSEAAKIQKSQRVLLQVNISGDLRKGGFAARDLLEPSKELVDTLSTLQDCVRIEGLMTVTAYYDHPEQARADYRSLASLAHRLQGSGILRANATLSMGMSGDFEVAIEEGATMVRIGTALFGERN